MAAEISNQSVSLSSGYSIPGFGEYALPPGTSFDQFVLTKKIYAAAMGILFGLGAVAVVAVAVILVPHALFMLSPIMILTSAGFLFFALKSVQHFLDFIATDQIYPPTQQLQFNPYQEPPGLLSRAPHSVTTLQSGVISNSMKLKLIKEAKSSIVLCGCYCGGRVFDEALDAINDKIASLREVYIIANDFYLTDSNKQKLHQLAQGFPNQFSYAMLSEVNVQKTPDTAEWSLIRLHVKGLVIDYGQQAIVGGRGLSDPWSRREEEIQYFAKQLQDVDHLIESPHPRGIGNTLYFEMLKLFAMYKYPEDPGIYQRLRQHGQLQFPETRESISNAKCKVLLSSSLHRNNPLLD